MSLRGGMFIAADKLRRIAELREKEREIARVRFALLVLADQKREERHQHQFDNIFGNGAGHIPLGSTIMSATFTLTSFDVSGSTATIGSHRMLTDWNNASSWNSLVNGVQANGVDAATTATATTTSPNTLGAKALDVTSVVQAWSGGQSNFG